MIQVTYKYKRCSNFLKKKKRHYSPNSVPLQLFTSNQSAGGFYCFARLVNFSETQLSYLQMGTAINVRLEIPASIPDSWSLVAFQYDSSDFDYRRWWSDRTDLFATVSKTNVTIDFRDSPGANSRRFG